MRVDHWPAVVPGARSSAPGPGRPLRPPALPPSQADRVAPDLEPDGLRRLAGRPPSGGTTGVRLDTTPEGAAAIAAGLHQVRTVDGRTLVYPSQDLTKIESQHPDEPGQTHATERHIGTTLAENVARIDASPHLRAAGSYTSLADAQFATDRTIANPANQHDIGGFLADPGRLKQALRRVDLGRPVGASTTRADVLAGRPRLIPGTTATVVLIKDPSFPEGYRVLTTYPDTRRPEVDERGTPLS